MNKKYIDSIPLISGIILILVFIFALYDQINPTSIIIYSNFSIVETKLCDALKIDKNELISSRHSQSHAEGELKHSLTMGIHSVKLLEYVPNEKLKFEGSHSYNIFASGKEKYEFEVTKINNNQIKIQANYFENTNLFLLIPVSLTLFGRDNESNMLKVIFNGMQ